MYLSFHVTRIILTYTGYWSARDGIIYIEVVTPELLCHLGHVVLGCPRANPLFVPMVWYKMQSALIFLSRIFEVW